MRPSDAVYINKANYRVQRGIMVDHYNELYSELLGELYEEYDLGFTMHMEDRFRDVFNNISIPVCQQINGRGRIHDL